MWCRGEDLNLHELPRLLLRQVRLPISPPRHLLHDYPALSEHRRQVHVYHLAATATLFICFAACAPTRIRTWDLLLKREQLYQLSYGCMFSILRCLPTKSAGCIFSTLSCLSAKSTRCNMNKYSPN